MTIAIRKANLSDREAAHHAHMRSIREVCVHLHGIEEVSGWGNRDLGDRWIKGIKDGNVWVVEQFGVIQGLASIVLDDQQKNAHIQALYLTPEVLGKGIGRSLMEEMLAFAKNAGVVRVTLESSLTAHHFYRKFGFIDVGPVTKHEIGGSAVSCIPMQMDLNNYD